MIISISGIPGAGKNTVAEKLAQKLNYTHYSMGDLIGKMAFEEGMTVNEMIGKPLNDIDSKVDNYQKKLAETENNFVIDGRISFYLIPYSIKIYLDVELSEGARRVFNNQRKDEQRYKSLEETLDANKKRIENEKIRYKAYDDINCHDKANYDLVIDTTNITADKAVEKILDYVKKL